MRHALAVLALAVLAALVYLPCRDGEFQFDDAMGVERGGWRLPKDPAARREALLRNLSNWSGRGWVGLSYQLNFDAAGGNEMRFLDLNAITRPFHLFNLAVHLLAVAGLYALLAWMAARAGRGGPALPLAGAALFALHPLATESVAYISARTGTVATCCTVWGALGLLVLAAPSRDGSLPPVLRRLAGWAWLAAFAALGAGFKETGWVTVPAGLLALGWCYAGDLRRLLRDWGLWLAAGGLAFAVAAGAWLERREMLSDAFLWQYPAIYALPPTRAVPAHAATQLNAWTSYHAPRLALPFGPFRNTVDPDPPLLREIPWGRVSLEALLVLALAWTAWRSWRRGSWTGLGIAWAVLGILPPALPALLDVTAERHAYLPLAGAALALAFGAAGLWTTLRGRLLLGAWAACLALLAGHRALQWRTEIALWSEALRDTPGKARPYYNLGKSVVRQYRSLPDAERPLAERLAAHANRLLARSLRLSPSFHLSHGALGRGLEFLGRREEALAELREAVHLHQQALALGEAPDLHGTLITVHTEECARLLKGLGRPDEAAGEFRKAAEYHLRQARAGDADPRFHLQHAAGLFLRQARFLESADRKPQARQALREGIALLPNCPPLREELSRLEGGP